MGRATITGNAGAGRYTIAVDYGSDQRDAVIASMQAQRVKLDNDLSELDVAIAEAEAVNTAALEALAASNAAYINGQVAAGQPEISPDELKFRMAEIDAQRQYVQELQAALMPLKIKRAQTLAVRADLLQSIADLSAAQMTATKDAWCVDYTTTASGTVGTVDVNGESTLTLIRPGGEAPGSSSGEMTSTHIMSPEQAFYNTALLPGWQKWKPTYRWGTITALNTAANTANVALADAESSQQRLGINQAETLSAVPVTYMTCNAEAFDVGDRVIVEFTGQDWSAPKVIGFLDNPKPCRWFREAEAFGYAQIIAYSTSSTYWDGAHFVQNWEVALDVNVSYSLTDSFGYSILSPASVNSTSYTLWSGKAIAGLDDIDVVNALNSPLVDGSTMVEPYRRTVWPAFMPGTSQVFLLLRTAGAIEDEFICTGVVSNQFPATLPGDFPQAGEEMTGWLLGDLVSYDVTYTPAE